jgi:hypothetical protein
MKNKISVPITLMGQPGKLAHTVTLLTFASIQETPGLNLGDRLFS